jgi:hypothetical protein
LLASVPLDPRVREAGDAGTPTAVTRRRVAGRRGVPRIAERVAEGEAVEAGRC